MAALVFFQLYIAAQGSGDPLPQESKDTFKAFISLYSDRLKWSDEWAAKALEYLKSPNTVKADMVITGNQSFSQNNTQLLREKLLKILKPRIDKKGKAIKRLPAGTVYGCNGVVDKKGNEDSISAACLYKKP
ncbi:unnamed protein product [Haemonchus placei]|uniref:Nuclear transport factor 2 family protein n=1 Tax=Haemonchus placei TaxID=6290 RepID=A0A0N4WSD2_HAEPC|nr:unnamed protein product [Haemonchus placei]